MEQIAGVQFLDPFTSSIYQLINRMAWGLALAILFVGIINRIPRELMTGLLGQGGTFSGILRATAAGVLLDLCSHGILLVGMKLYERGASLGQTMAFLIASPWNSLSLTLILWALVGFKWMISFLLLSVLIAIISGIIFDGLVKRKVLPENPNKVDLPENFIFFYEAGRVFKKAKFTPKNFAQVVKDGLGGSRMILRWIFLGVILASFLRSFLSSGDFQALFGPTLAGLGLTLVAATIIEVCSEGSTPIAADILQRAGAPGNAFAFLMTGVSTDYTEILSIKETTKSWKISLFLPLVTIPQVVLIAIIMNNLI
ncbi:ATPase [Candidatus Peregrinibacteria bacterium]|nr:ATPase [Candidatus Peregrinibacteria bacterium]